MHKRLADFYHNKHILVTGGAGFIGSHVVEKLVALGSHVTVLDNLSTGTLANLQHLYHTIRFIKATITDPTAYQHAVADSTLVIHLAALASVPACTEQPLVAHMTNITGTLALLEAARQAHLERFLFASSSAVYGNCALPCHEDMTPQPQSFYGLLKLFGERYVQHYAQTYSLNALSLRFFNVFGPRQNADSPHAGVIAQWRKKIAAGEQITLSGDGSQTRDFIPVTFVADTIIKLASLPDRYLRGDAVNIASGKSTSLTTLLSQLVGEFPSYNLPICYSPKRQGDIDHSSADCKKLMQLLAAIDAR
jgi:nucleoside-diphosphate-sugar epimerase